MKHKRSLLSIAMAAIMLISLCAVVSTSVSAATSSANAKTSTHASTNVHSGLVGAPAGIVGAPAVTSQAANSYDLFVTGADHAVWYRHSAAGTWGAWKSLGGHLTSSPGAASYGGGGIFVAARGGNGALYRTYTPDGGSTWDTWLSWGGQLLAETGPAVVSPSPGTIRLAVIGTNHALYWWEGSWRSLGGYLTSSPCATSSASGIFVAARGGNGALYDRYTTDGGLTWSTWSSYGGQILAGTNPAIVSDGTWVRYFVIGTNHALYWYYGGWVSLNGYLTSGPAAASHSAGTIDVFALGSDGDIWSRRTTNFGGSWNPWYELPA